MGAQIAPIADLLSNLTLQQVQEQLFRIQSILPVFIIKTLKGLHLSFRGLDLIYTMVLALPSLPNCGKNSKTKKVWVKSNYYYFFCPVMEQIGGIHRLILWDFKTVIVFVKITWVVPFDASSLLLIESKPISITQHLVQQVESMWSWYKQARILARSWKYLETTFWPPSACYYMNICVKIIDKEPLQ